MSKIILEEKQIKEYVSDSINDAVIGKIHIATDLYHHNTSYQLAPSVIKYGILSIEGIHKKGIKTYSEDVMNIMGDVDSHVNGKNGVSLAVAGLTDLYPNEEEYNPFRVDMVDFLITKKIKTYRMTIHYGNEYVTTDIEPDKLLSLDIRLLNFVENLEQKTDVSYGNNNITNLIQKYNYLLETAKMIKQTNLNIPIREMTNDDNLSLDVDKLANYPKILIKK